MSLGGKSATQFMLNEAMPLTGVIDTLFVQKGKKNNAHVQGHRCPLNL